MSLIRVKDRDFKRSITAEQIAERIQAIAAQIVEKFKDKDPLFLVVLNGSFVFAADLLRQVNISCGVSFLKMSSYEGMSSTGAIKQLIGLNEDIAGRNVVIVEDIIDTGYTMQHLYQTLQDKNPASLSIVTLLVKPDSLRVDLHIDYSCFHIPNDFIVGYGLDYDGYGRNLPEIYTVVAEG